MRPYSFKLIFLLAVTTFFAAGCSTGGVKTGDSSFNQQFVSGQIRLTCGLSCSGTAGAARRKLKNLYSNDLWGDLAKEVSGIGFEIDRNYFYLGMAAEKLGHLNAAKTYYQLGLATTSKCGGRINVCDGFRFPADINGRLNAINAMQAQESRLRSKGGTSNPPFAPPPAQITPNEKSTPILEL